MPAVATVAGLPNKLGKYELLMPLAAGGMARIYIGRSIGIGSFERHVVLKLITPERANDQTAIQMFLDEARLAASLNHQNVAQVFEVGEDLGIHYLAMEYVHGQDLRALLAKAGSQGTRIPLELALTVVAGAAAGLNHAHERRAADGTPLGIVHRDVSPSNIMIGYDGSVKLLDFGIAKATSRSVETQSGIIKGKFAYMAPEQCRGRDVDRRSDVFSLGIILYEISTQHRCFRADSDFDTMHRIVTGDVVRPSRLVQGYPPALEAIVMKALAVDAIQRYQSAGLLLEALEAFSIANRFSLSTMGLGRFMRDMFGEIQEPWLGAPHNPPPVVKENTISSTDGRSEVSAAPMLDEPGLPRQGSAAEWQRGVADRAERAATETEPPGTAIPDSDARFPDSGAADLATVVNVSHAHHLQQLHGEAHDELATEVLRPSAHLLRMSQAQIGELPTVVHGSQPLPLVTQTGPQLPTIVPPAGAFPSTPGSGSHPSHAALPAIPSTRHGYASGVGMTQPGGPQGDLGYPRYEPTGETGDVQIRPNRRMLYLAIGALVIGLVVIIALIASGGTKLKDTDGITVGSDPGSAVLVAPPPPPPTPPPAPVDANIKIHVGSQPRGADVLIAGTKVGVTPFDGVLARGASVTTLVVHLAGYDDFQSKIDLSDEYTNDKIELVKTPDKIDAGSGSDDVKADKPDKPPIVHNPIRTPPPRPVVHSPPPAVHTAPPAPPPKPKCQPQGQVNPFDTSCGGKACPVCSS